MVSQPYSLTSLVDELPLSLNIDAPSKAQLKTALHTLDRLIFVDADTKDVYVDIEQFKLLARQSLGSQFKSFDPFISLPLEDLNKFSSRSKAAKNLKLAPVSWQTFRQHLPAFTPNPSDIHACSAAPLDRSDTSLPPLKITSLSSPSASANFFSSLGINSTSSIDDIQAALSSIVPERFWDAEFSKSAFLNLFSSEPASSSLYAAQTSTSNLTYGQRVWYCLVRTVGFWTAFAVFAAVIAALSTGIGAALIPVLAVIIGGTAAVALLNCLLNTR